MNPNEVITKLGMDLSKRIVDLEDALGLALEILGKQEPGDSRAVSNEFVSMAAVLANCANDEARQIIRSAHAGMAA